MIIVSKNYECDLFGLLFRSIKSVQLSPSLPTFLIVSREARGRVTRRRRFPSSWQTGLEHGPELILKLCNKAALDPARKQPQSQGDEAGGCYTWKLLERPYSQLLET